MPMTEDEKRGVLEMASDFQPNRYGYRDAQGMDHLDPVACLLVYRGHEYWVDRAGKILFKIATMLGPGWPSPEKQAMDDICEWLHIQGDDIGIRRATYLTLLLNFGPRIFERINGIPNDQCRYADMKEPREWSNLRRMISDDDGVLTRTIEA